VTQKDFATTLVASGNADLIGLLFLLGVLLQALVALLNKWVNWGLYHYDEIESETKPSARKFCEYICDKVWIDIGADIATLLLFGVATVLVVREIGRSVGAA
jgi:hypothetical protein